MKIAIYQCEGMPKNVEKNLKDLQRVANSAAEQGARLIIFPELFLTGYNIGEAVIDLAERVNGQAAQKASSIAQEANIALLYGYPERFDKSVYNAAILIDHNGQTLANYRKTHLFGSYEKRTFQAGDALVLAELEGLKIGILICYDIEFPEAVRKLVFAEAGFIAVPTALMRPYCRIAETVVPTRAYESQIFVAYVNRCGSEGDLIYCGNSRIVGPDGEDVVRAGSKQGIFVADIDATAITSARKNNPILADLRTELYTARVKDGLP
ncbi:MAG: carbon-nitrogen hydrolase family protein [Deltaproteobacteria bacterium]|jgi:predicted amidohydrolase|nr:carbon-nitrogen hydrolase family protein [Deltaproteobacteria bacterium]